ncbi:Glutaredoxin [Salimicrobium flavidum]|uniref:Glutaredoxin n=2 Tax=Salimicrobium flavidum TaxID=570947 RepID=A0A1N7J7U3_9BACI|nr:Glutaredoxin [Salimicrobium flavidum]
MGGFSDEGSLYDGCLLCMNVIQHLENQGIDYQTMNILEDHQQRDGLKRKIGEVYVPVLEDEGQFTIGEDILQTDR